MSRVIFKLPDVGEGVVEAEIAKWYVAAGDMVEEDQHLVDVMTDKATVEITSPVAGVIQAITGKPGELVPVGTDLIVFETDAAAVEKVEEKVEETVAAPAPKPAAVKAEKPAPKPVAAAGAKPLASPAVRLRAMEKEIDLADVPGSGPAGRISHADLDAFIASGGRPAPQTKHKRSGTTEIPIIGLRRKIAERMQTAKQHIPHITYVDEVDITALDELRQHLNTKHGSARPKLTLLPFIMAALVKALDTIPHANAHYDDEKNILAQHAPVHIGIATQTPDGLKVPVVKHAESLDLWQMAAEVARLADAARNNTAKLDDLTGSTITITSLGRLGGIVTTPIINYPEVAIIGVNNAVDRAVVRQGQIVIRKMMNLSSSFDHRIVDGADAAELVQAMKVLLEQPATLFIE